MSDWRLQGQEKYLRGVTLVKKRYEEYREGWDHDHCEFCSKKFSLQDGEMSCGYATEDNYRWVCETCFNDFSELFHWEIVKR